MIENGERIINESNWNVPPLPQYLGQAGVISRRVHFPCLIKTQFHSIGCAAYLPDIEFLEPDSILKFPIKNIPGYLGYIRETTCAEV